MFPVIADVKMFPSVRNAMTSVLPDASPSSANPRSVEEKRSDCGSELDDFAIIRGLVFDLAQSNQHILAHVGEDDPFGADRRQVLAQDRQRKMRAHRLVIHIAFTDGQVGASRDVGQRIDPLGVAGVADRSTFELDAVGKAWAGAIVVPHVGGTIASSPTWLAAPTVTSSNES